MGVVGVAWHGKLGYLVQHATVPPPPDRRMSLVAPKAWPVVLSRGLGAVLLHVWADRVLAMEG